MEKQIDSSVADALDDADSTAAVGPCLTMVNTSADASSPRSNHTNDSDDDDDSNDNDTYTNTDGYLDNINLNSTSTGAPLFSLKSSATDTTMGGTTTTSIATSKILPGLSSNTTGLTGIGSSGSTSFAIGSPALAASTSTTTNSSTRIGISRSTSTRTYAEQQQQPSNSTNSFFHLQYLSHQRSTSSHTMPNYWNLTNSPSADSQMATIGGHPSPHAHAIHNLHQSPVLSPRKPPVDVNVGDEFEIEEGTPAAEALKANAKVKVTKIRKAARYMNAQTINKIWRRKAGNKKGKPPRVPDVPGLTRRWSDGDIDMVGPNFSSLKGIHEGEDEEDDGSSMDDIRIDVRYYDKDEEYDNDNSNFYHLDRKDAEEEKEEVPKKELLSRKSSVEKWDAVEASIRDYNEVSPTGTEDEPDATYVEYDANQFDTQTDAQPIVLRDKHGKKRVFTKFKRNNKRKESKKKSRNYVKGKVIEKEHELYTLSIAVMLGLRYAIYQTHIQLENDKKDKLFWLDSEEFMRMQKYVFRPDGRKGTPPHKLAHTFKFKDYSPVPFAYIRRMFGINEYEFIHSVCGNANFIEFISNAKSGQFFFYSSDGKYMIKTMTNTESKFLRRILPHYFRHCAQNPSTLMTKFLGMYRVKLYHLQRDVKFVVMNSVFDTDKMISSFYDLKGSSYGREAKPGESVKKDNDVRQMIKDNPQTGGFMLPPSIRSQLREQVVRDCEFLKEMKIMDYSMLVGVHYVPSKSAVDSGDSIQGLVFRDSESIRSVRSRKKEPIGKFKRSRSENVSRNNRQVTPKQSNASPNPTKSFGKSKVEFLLDEDVLKNELLEHKPSDSSFRPNSPFNMSEIDRIISDNSVLSTSTLGFGDDEEFYPAETNRAIRKSSEEEGVSSPMSENSNLEWQKEKLQIDNRREEAIEQSYWPFHRYYEINGQRRVLPINDTYRTDKNYHSDVNDSDVKCTTCLGDPRNFDPDLAASRKKWQLKDFEKPVSNRKDGGLEMDVTGVQVPIKVKIGNQTQECGKKIFYMGVIDILQQFNVRKRMEARYRRIKGAGWDGASCVHPDFYAERFIKFFDEYTKRGGITSAPESIHPEEEISFADC